MGPYARSIPLLVPLPCLLQLFRTLLKDKVLRGKEEMFYVLSAVSFLPGSSMLKYLSTECLLGTRGHY